MSPQLFGAVHLLQLGERAGQVAGAIGLQAETLVEKGLKALVILVLAWGGRRLLKVLTRRIERAVEDQDRSRLTEREQRARTLAQLLNSIGAVVIAVGAGLMVLNLFISIGPLLAGVGVAGLAISFGAQSLVKDVISGFFMLLENQFGVGDVVEINGKTGVVEQMTLRVVSLRDVRGHLHIIPNGAISMVSNRTRDFSRAVLDVGVGYGESVDRVIAVMNDLAQEFWNDQKWRAKLRDQPVVWGVQALGDSAVTMRLVANTLPGLQDEVNRELLRRIKNRFDAEGIEIPFPQRTVHLGDAGGLLDALSKRPPA